MEYYNSVDIAKYIVNKCCEEKNPTSNLKLQMMMYLMADDFFRENKQHLFLEDFNAFGFGPALPNAYYHFAGFGAMPIVMNYKVNINEADKVILNPLIDKYSCQDCSKLTAKVREKDGPWRQVYDIKKGRQTDIIVPLPSEMEHDMSFKQKFDKIIGSYEMSKEDFKNKSRNNDVFDR